MPARRNTRVCACIMYTTMRVRVRARKLYSLRSHSTKTENLINDERGTYVYVGYGTQHDTCNN